MLQLPPDKLAHLQGGAALAALLLTLLMLAHYVGAWAAMAAGSIALAIGVEVYQRVRNEGTASWADAAFSAAPGLLVAAILWAEAS